MLKRGFSVGEVDRVEHDLGCSDPQEVAVGQRMRPVDRPVVDAGAVGTVEVFGEVAIAGPIAADPQVTPADGLVEASAPRPSVEASCSSRSSFIGVLDMHQPSPFKCALSRRTA